MPRIARLKHDRPDSVPDHLAWLEVGSPLESARDLLQQNFTDADGDQYVQHHREELYCYDGRRYAVLTPEALRSVGYRFAEEAMTMGKRKSPDGGDEWVPVPFNPTISKVKEITEAFTAFMSSHTLADMPCWADGRDHPLDYRKAPSPRHILACHNGLLDLNTRELLPHTPNYFCANALDTTYDPDAPKPARWLQFMSELWPSDQQMIDTLQEMFGLLLTPDTSFQKIFLLLGTPGSGRSTILRVLARLIGEGNTTAPTLNSLAERFGMTSMIGKRAALIADVRLGHNVDAAGITQRLLTLSGQDPVQIERKNIMIPWEGRPDVRIVIVANDLPTLPDTSNALHRRLLLIRLRENFVGREDFGLEAKLLAELPGILNWSLDGLERLRARGKFIQPEDGIEEMEDLRNLNSPIRKFLDDECTVHPGLSEPKHKLYNRYQVWCADAGMPSPPAQTFGKMLKSALPKLGKDKPGVKGQQVERYVGIGPKNSTPAASGVDGTVVNVEFTRRQPRGEAGPVFPPAKRRARPEVQS